MKKFLILFLAATLAVIAAPSLDATASNTGGLAGIVVDTAGNPVPRAAVRVEIMTPSGQVFTARTETDRQGHFGFRRLPAGPGVVKAGKRGVGRGAVRGAIIPGQVVRARIVLR